jgi:hypothetical protein
LAPSLLLLQQRWVVERRQPFLKTGGQIDKKPSVDGENTKKETSHEKSYFDNPIACLLFVFAGRYFWPFCRFASGNGDCETIGVSTDRTELGVL